MWNSPVNLMLPACRFRRLAAQFCTLHRYDDAEWIAKNVCTLEPEPPGESATLLA